MQVSTIGVDLAKNVFQVHGVDSAGKNPLSGSWASKPVRMIGTGSADYIRASGHGAAQTGRTHDLHPTASRTSDSSCNAGVVHT
jgi:hypothetical protein